jgi:general secretion pathway protein G
MRAQVRKAFTLVEILIVVVILGILAAIVVPQFTRATQEAQAGNLQSQLDMLNNQLELWRARHNGYLPTENPAGGAAAGISLAGYDWQTMIEPDGVDPDSGGYLKSPPVNPINNSSDVADALTVGTGWAWVEDPRYVGVYRLWACEYDHVQQMPTPGLPGVLP